MGDLGPAAVVVPELGALRGVEQNVFHHRDVHGHTLEVLGSVAHLETGPPELGEHAEAVREMLAEPLADELTRGGGMRFAALLHDAAKPLTRGMRPDGRVTFVGHDAAGGGPPRGGMRPRRAPPRPTPGAAPPPPPPPRPRLPLPQRPPGGGGRRGA